MTRRLVGRMIRVDSGDIHVRVDGPEGAPTLVLIHGFGASLHWWDRLTGLLSDRYRVVRPDLLGHGGSSKPPSGYHPTDQARMVSEVLVALGVEKATVVGHSMGADIAVALAERSSLVVRLALVGKGPDASCATIPRLQRVLRAPVIGQALQVRSPAPAVRHGYSLSFAPGFRMASAFDDRNQVLADERAHSFAAFRQGLIGMEDYTRVRGLDERVHDLSLPVLVIFGARDQFWSSFTSVARYRAVPNALVRVIDGAGHTPQVETPSLVARLIDEFAASD
jgi:pimeloyl-ACP methyl ester carboxylesterase